MRFRGADDSDFADSRRANLANIQSSAHRKRPVNLGQCLCTENGSNRRRSSQINVFRMPIACPYHEQKRAPRHELRANEPSLISASSLPVRAIHDLDTLPSTISRMAVRFRPVWAYPRGSVDIDRVIRAAKASRFHLKLNSDTSATFHSRFNWRSWGERLDVELSIVNREMLVDVTSVCRLPTQIVDFGRNESNVVRLRQAMDANDAAAPSRSVPLCSVCGYPAVDVAPSRCSECGNMLDADPSQGYESGSSLVVVLTITAISIAMYFIIMLFMGIPIDAFNVVCVMLAISMLPGFWLWRAWQRSRRRQQ